MQTGTFKKFSGDVEVDSGLIDGLARNMHESKRKQGDLRTPLAMTEGTIAKLVKLPFPWPPAQPHLVYGGEELELIGLPDGRLRVTISSSQKVFLSQPIDTNSTKPQWALFIITWSASLIRVGVSGIDLLQDAPGVPKAVLPLQVPVPDELSINDPNASVACQ